MLGPNQVDPTKILDDPDDIEFLRSFIGASNTATTANMNMTRVASEVFLARMIKDTERSLKRSLEQMTESLEQALADHAEALNRSAEASTRHAASLKWATWALVAATVGLLVVTLLQQ